MWIQVWFRRQCKCIEDWNSCIALLSSSFMYRRHQVLVVEPLLRSIHLWSCGKGGGTTFWSVLVSYDSQHLLNDWLMMHRKSYRPGLWALSWISPMKSKQFLEALCVNLQEKQIGCGSSLYILSGSRYDFFLNFRLHLFHVWGSGFMASFGVYPGKLRNVLDRGRRGKLRLNHNVAESMVRTTV